MKLDSMTSLYVSELRDMHSAEKQLIAALPKMAKAASTPELAEAFQDHLEQTKVHLERLNSILADLGESAGREKCEAMAGLVTEGKEVIDADADEIVRDVALIVAAQKVEHYEIAGYGSLCTFAKLMGRRQDQKLLGQTLDEEKNADSLLTKIAESHVNMDAANETQVVTRSSRAKASRGS
jgi:ferritin-like metal-binding protein YciE